MTQKLLSENELLRKENNHLTAENAKLRELLGECVEWIPSLDLDGYPLELYSRIKAMLGE